MKKLTDLYYYNQYESNNFKYKPNFREPALIDIIDSNSENKKDFKSYIPYLIPYIIVIVIGVLFIIPFIILWFCLCFPKCCCRKKSRITKPIYCVILTLILSGISLAFGISVCILIYYSKKDVYGTICTLSMLGFDIVDGVGTLRKQQFKNPYWRGVTTIGTVLGTINKEVMKDIVDNCDKNLRLGEPLETLSLSYTAANNFENTLKNIPSTTTTTFQYENPDKNLVSVPMTIEPTFISSLGNINDNTTDLGKIYQNYYNGYRSMLDNYIFIISSQCKILSQGNKLETPLTSVSDITGTLEDSMSTITEDVVDLLNEYKDYITEYLFGTFLGFNIVLMIFILIEASMILFYANRNYNLLRKHIICLWAFIGFILLFFFIFAGIFGAVSILISDVADIVDFIFSHENLISDKPRIITQNENLKKIETCLRGDGDLLSVFIEDEETRQFTDFINSLFNTHLKIVNYYNLINDKNDNDFKILSSITNLLNYYEIVEEDFSLSTTKEQHGNNDVSVQIEELNKYTVYGKYYQDVCNNRIYDYFVTSKDKCPSNSDYNCLLITDTTISSSRYDPLNVCKLVTSKSPFFNDVEEAYLAFSKFLVKGDPFSGTPLISFQKNIDLKLEALIDEIKSLKGLYQNCLDDAEPRLKAIIDDITGPVYNYFKGYVDLELAESGEEVDVFSWMNCSVFGRDLNATLNIMKRHFKKDLQNIFIITLVNNGVIIVEMILITFILNWYKYDPLENNPVGEMEINEKKIGDNEKDKEKVEYEEEEDEDEDEDEEEIDEETDNDFHKNSMSLTNDEKKKKNEMDSPKRIEINKGIKNNLIDNNKYLPSESSSSEDNFKLKMSQKLNKEDDKNGN